MFKGTIRAAVVAVVAVLAGALLVQAQDAAARTAPSVTLSAVATSIDVNEAPQFTYSTSHLPTGAVVQLQRLTLSNKWAVIKSVPRGQNRTVTAQPLTFPGKFPYRMQALVGTTVVAQSPTTPIIYAYGDISIESLCPHTAGTRVCAKINTNVNGATVTTHMAIGSAVYPNYFAGANFSPTTCRSATLIFTNPHNATAKTWLKLAQTGHTAQVASAAHSAVGHLTATLGTGQLFFDGSTEGTSYSVYVDGTLSCWSTTGT